MHENGIVHCDLKPMNIVQFSEESRWKLIDFDSAVEAGVPSAISATITYAAPEIIRATMDGQEEMALRASADMFSIGVIAYEVLAGRFYFMTLYDSNVGERLLKRFYGPNANAEVVQHTLFNGELPSLSCIPERQARSFIRKLLLLDPDKRRPVVRCLQHGLFQPGDCTSMIIHKNKDDED